LGTLLTTGKVHYSPQTADVFLDPDIGIATSNGRRGHIKVLEIGKLLAKSDRVLIVYQHSGRGSFHERLLKITDAVSHDIPGVHCAVYECGQVAVFFISLSKGRIHEIQNGLREYLRGITDSRVWGTMRPHEMAIGPMRRCT
jgi:hypothetical protein